MTMFASINTAPAANESPHMTADTCRLFAGLESYQCGHGGDALLGRFLGLAADTVARGRRELFAGQVQTERVRAPGGGRPRAEKKRPRS